MKNKENEILKKIEKLVDQLPYRRVEIEVELPGRTLVLKKEKPVKIGFFTEEGDT